MTFEEKVAKRRADSLAAFVAQREQAQSELRFALQRVAELRDIVTSAIRVEDREAAWIDLTESERDVTRLSFIIKRLEEILC
jgi:UDP-glucose 4-epimerase